MRAVQNGPAMSWPCAKALQADHPVLFRYLKQSV